MKIRNGFVSNSSSSSFCIIGVHNEMLANDIADQLNIDDDWKEENLGYGVAETNDDVVFGGYDGEIYYAGFNAEPLLETMTLPQAKEKVVEMFKERNIDVNLASIGFHYGELSSG
jgi:hypothetical protein